MISGMRFVDLAGDLVRRRGDDRVGLELLAARAVDRELAAAREAEIVAVERHDVRVLRLAIEHDRKTERAAMTVRANANATHQTGFVVLQRSSISKVKS